VYITLLDNILYKTVSFVIRWHISVVNSNAGELLLLSEEYFALLHWLSCKNRTNFHIRPPVPDVPNAPLDEQDQMVPPVDLATLAAEAKRMASKLNHEQRAA
jgi:hypothetical protein